MATWMTLKITDGTPENTVDLVDNVNFSLAQGGWAPSIAERKHSIMGGRSEFLPTVERIQVFAHGDTGAEALANQAKLARILDQSEAFANGAEVAPVMVQVQPQGSTMTGPSSAMILGHPENQSFMVNPNDWAEQIAVNKTIGPITVQFERRGLWLYEEETVSTAAVANPAIMSVNFAHSLDLPAPTAIALNDISAGTELIQKAFVLVTDTPAASTFGENFGLYLAGDMSSTEFSSVDESANLMPGTNAKRIDASVNQTGTLTISAVAAEVKHLAIFLAARNDTAAAWRIRPRSSGYSDITGDWVEIPASAAVAPYYIGPLISAHPSHYNINLDVETDATSGTLTIGWVCTFPITQFSRAIQINSGSYSSAGVSRVLRVEHRLLEALDPLLYVENET